MRYNGEKQGVTKDTDSSSAIVKNSSDIDGGWGWVIVGVSFLNVMLTAVSVNVFSALYMEQADYFDTSLAMMGAIASCQIALTLAGGTIILTPGVHVLSYSIGTYIVCV